MHIGVGFEQFHIKESKHTYTPRVVRPGAVPRGLETSSKGSRSTAQFLGDLELCGSEGRPTTPPTSTVINAASPSLLPSFPSHSVMKPSNWATCMKNVRCDMQGTPLDRLCRASRAALSIARRLDLVSPWLYRRLGGGVLRFSFNQS